MNDVKRRKLQKCHDQILADSEQYANKLVAQFRIISAAYRDEIETKSHIPANLKTSEVAEEIARDEESLRVTDRIIFDLCDQVRNLNFYDLKRTIGDAPKRPSRAKKPVMRAVTTPTPIAPITK